MGQCSGKFFDKSLKGQKSTLINSILMKKGKKSPVSKTISTSSLYLMKDGQRTEDFEDQVIQAAMDAMAEGTLKAGVTYEARVTCREIPQPSGHPEVQGQGGQAAEMPQQPDRQKKISERITPEILSTLGPPGQHAHASSTRHQWQAGKHTIIQQIDVETKTEPLPCSEAKGCCHEGLEGRLSSSSKHCDRDLPGAESVRSCGDGEHSECSESQHSQSDDCKHHENSPCDCCRHGHSLTSFIRSPEDCRTCFRHMGGAFVSPKYPQIRQRMLKTLNQRRDHSEDPDADPDAPKVKVAPLPIVNSIPCGKKETLVIFNPEHGYEDVDDLVKMIEGTKPCNDPRKAAKKARQKEKKIQSKVEEDLRREEEERKMREEEERIRRDIAEREEEERRKAEELKRQARRMKKKNRKKKDADEKIAGSLQPMSNGDERQNDSSLLLSVTGSTSPSETVRKVLETANPLTDDGANGEKPRMVTIRRHPATNDNQNVVTITLCDDKEGKSPVYMLLNGHLSSNAFSGPGQMQEGQRTEETPSCASDKGKKKNKKKVQPQQKNQRNSLPESSYSFPERDAGSSVSSLHNNIPATTIPKSSSNHHEHLSSVDLDNLSLPPGITITKVENTSKHEGLTDKTSMTPQSTVSQYRAPAEQQLYFVDDDDDFLGRKETQEFEEVINKTRRKKMKAARTTNDRDGSEETEARESPCSIKNLTRRPFICDSKAIPEKLIESPKVVHNGKGLIKSAPTYKKTNGSYTTDHQNGGAKPRRDHTTFRHDAFSSVNHTQVPVMPRLHRVHLKNRETSGISHCHVAPPNYDGRQLYSSFEPQNSQLNGMTVSDRNFTNAPLTSPQQQQLGSRGNGVISAPPPASWTTQSQGQGQGTAPISHPASLSVQPEHEQEGSWNPWKDWSEHSTPEHPSPRFGVGDQFYRDAPPPKTYAFHDLNQKSKSPIQRPTTHNPQEGNSAQLNGTSSFPRDFPPTTRPFTTFDESAEREAIFRFHQQQLLQQQQQRQTSQFTPDFESFNGQRTFAHPTEQEKVSWSAFSGVQTPTYLQRRSSEKGDFILTQQGPTTPTRGKSGDISWEPYSGKKSPLQETAERLHQLSLSPLTELSDLPPILATAISPGYRIGTFNEHPAMVGGFVGAPRSDWQVGPSTAQTFSTKTPFQPPQESYNWDLGPSSFHSRYTGGGAGAV